MRSPSPVAKANADVIAWMQRFEARLRLTRSGLGAVDGRPRVDRLHQMQRAGATQLSTLIAAFWAQPPASRIATQPAYLSALLTLKLFADDVYIEAAEEARQPKATGAAPSPASVQPIETAYQNTIEAWIVGSPLIDPNTFKGNEQFLPKIQNMIDFSQFRNISTPTRLTAIGKTPPLERARAVIQQEIREIIAAKDKSSISNEANHLLGVVFLLAQLELKLRWENDQTRQSDVDSWYQAALRPVQVIAADVLGAFDAAQRDAIVGDSAAEAERLLTARDLAVLDMATHHSLRRQETRTLLTFFDKQNKTGRFAYQDTAFGVNRVKETLFAYVARSNPDDQANREALSVASVHARESELSGKNVRVFGAIDRSRTKLIDELTRSTLVVTNAQGMTGLTGAGADRRVIVEGRLTGSGSSLALAAITVVPHSEGYRALVGFPLEFAQTDERGNLDQLPAWRRLTAALQRAAVREHRDRELGVFSVAETLAGQREFVTGLLHHEEIRKTFASSLKTNLDLDLQDVRVRTSVWSVLFKEFARAGNHNAIRLLIAYVQRYLALFTRHTYFNLRDSGTSYLSSNWPTDLTNRKLQDCGVYAVQTAYDLFRAVQGTRSLSLEFRFVTFLNHLCLVVYFDNAAFLVNNATIHLPVDVVPSGTPTADQRIAAAFAWAEVAFTTVYDVDHIIFLAVVPRLSLDTNRSDAEFKHRIWKMYQDSQGWGTTNDETIAADYFRAISLFDASSKLLAERLKRLASGHQAAAADWNDATTRGLELYALAEKLSDAQNFIFFNDAFTRKKPIPAIGFAIRPPADSGRLRLATPHAGRPATLPMYQLGELLSQRKRRGQTLTADQEALAQKPRGKEHVTELTAKLRTAAARP
jgi:hypothetical protein